MTEENQPQKFRLKSIDETRNYFTEEINQTGMISKKHKNTCLILILNVYLFWLERLMDVFKVLLLLLRLLFL